jgi:chromate transporter
VVIVAAGFLGAIYPSMWRGPEDSAVGTEAAVTELVAPRRRGEAVRHASLWLALWLAPPLLLAVLLGTEHILFQIALLFSILACVTFGGAYAALVYLTAEAAARSWLTPEQMIDGLGLAETTPGPLILVNEFVGFLAGWGAGGLGMALAGAALAVWCTFAPSFVWIFAGAPISERLQDNPRAAGALATITAAVLGVIAKLALFFTTHALFTAQVAWGPVELPEFASARPWMLGLALGAGAALIWLRANLLAVLAACALAGLAAHAAGL